MASNLFTGASRYSQDFSAVIERSVGIASLALTQMQKARLRSNDELTALRILETKIITLQGTIKGVEEGVTTKALQTTSSDSTSVRVSSSDGVAPGSYTLNVVSLGSYATSVSKTDGRPSISDPTAGTFVAAGSTKLTLRITDYNTGSPGAADTEIDLSAGTSLQNVADAINAQAGGKVQAAIVNLGSTSAPNYALSLQSKQLGKYGLQVIDGTDELMSVDTATLADPLIDYRAQYKLNGTTVYSDSRTVTIAPKLTADLLKADSTKEITLTINQGTGSFSTAMNSFIAAYNGVVEELDKSTSGGALAGNSIVSSVRRQLKAAVDFIAPSGAFDSLSKVGVEFTKDGRLSLNATLLSSETKDNFHSLKKLIGTTTSSGFAKAATDALNAIESSTGGFLKDSISSLDSSLKSEDARIAAESARVEQFTRDLQERLAKADALIAQMEQQANYFNNMFEAMRVNQRSMS